MQTAQKLNEVVDLSGMGQTALIMYMRTDSTRLSNDRLVAVRDFIGTSPSLGQRYLPAKPNAYASGKSAQEAHEAIRPTDVTITPARAKQMGLGGDQFELYQLIWRRFVASQCVPAVVGVTTYDITAGRGLFRARGQVGKVVTDFLVQHFPKIMDLKFTSHFEEELDDIETGKCQYREVLDEFWGPFSQLLKKAGDEAPPVRELTGEMCPKCGRPLERRYSVKSGGEVGGRRGRKETVEPCNH